MAQISLDQRIRLHMCFCRVSRKKSAKLKALSMQLKESSKDSRGNLS
jgi:hypothetical protein